jgi:hypothetical protein
LFLAVYGDIEREHGKIYERLLENSKDLGIKERLHYNFTGVINYFCKEQEAYYFCHQSLFHVPSELREEFRFRNLEWEMRYQKKLEEIFAEGMRQGVIRKGSPEKKVWSFRINWSVVLGWMVLSRELKMEMIEEIWNDFWFGVAERNEEKPKEVIK